MLFIIICAILTSSVNGRACVHIDGITPNETPCDCGSTKIPITQFCYKWTESGNDYSLIGRSDPANFEIYYKLDAVSPDQVRAGAVDTDAFCNKLDLFATIMSPNQCKDAAALLYDSNIQFVAKVNDNESPLGCSKKCPDSSDPSQCRLIWNVGKQSIGMHVESYSNDVISKKCGEDGSNDVCLCGKFLKKNIYILVIYIIFFNIFLSFLLL